jgi:hypothetical protein
MNKRKTKRGRDGGVICIPLTEPVLSALEALARTGFHGPEPAAVAEELLRRALLSPEVIEHWKLRRVGVM